MLRSSSLLPECQVPLLTERQQIRKQLERLSTVTSSLAKGKHEYTHTDTQICKPKGSDSRTKTKAIVWLLNSVLDFPLRNYNSASSSPAEALHLLHTCQGAVLLHEHYRA